MTQQSDETILAVMQNDMSYMRKSVDSLDRKFDTFTATYTLKTDFEEVKTKVEGLEKKVYLFMGGLAVITFALKFLVK